MNRLKNGIKKIFCTGSTNHSIKNIVDPSYTAPLPSVENVVDPSYAYPLPLNLNHIPREAKTISFPQADNDYTPPLFFPTENWKGGSRSGFRSLKNALQVLYATLEDMGYPVNRCSPDSVDVVFDWSGKVQNYSTTGTILYMEHGWLPRYAYQISCKGTNSKSHVANGYKFTELGEVEKLIVNKFSDRMRIIFNSKSNLAENTKILDHITCPHILFPLQLATDYNLLYSNTHLSKYYGSDANSNAELAQGCIDYVESAKLPLPVVFKQHPVDKTEDLPSKLRFRDDRNRLITNRDQVSTTDIFATDLCKLVISINSNTLHEALVYDIPGISLGTLIWNESVDHRPFPKDLTNVQNLLDQGKNENSHRTSYLYHLIRNQWFLSDFQNPLIVKALIDTKAHVTPFELRCKYGLENPIFG